MGPARRSPPDKWPRTKNSRDKTAHRCWFSSCSSYTRRIPGEKAKKGILFYQRLKWPHFNSLDSDAALNAAWACRTGMISYVPRSTRVAVPTV